MENSVLALGKPDSKEPAPLLVVRDLQVGIGKSGNVKVIDGVSFELQPGETLGLVGESGSGKSVTGLAIMGLLNSDRIRVTGGSIQLEGRELVGLPEKAMAAVRGREAAMIFQEPMTSLNPAFTIGEQIAEVVRKHEGKSRTEAWAAAIEMLDRVGIPNALERARRYPHEFSGGMRQRAMIAIALICRPKVLIADEPTTALDVTIQAQILDVLKAMSKELGVGMIFITHSAGVVADICDRVSVMYSGQVVEMAPVMDLFGKPRHPYTSGLLRSIPPIDRTVEVLASIPGSPPAPGSIAEGCRFAPRCPYVISTCRRGLLALTSPAPGRSVRCIRSAELVL
jgi:oligopeptide/dipeptide ABC transporter ATP-binding protein